MKEQNTKFLFNLRHEEFSEEDSEDYSSKFSESSSEEMNELSETDEIIELVPKSFQTITVKCNKGHELRLMKKTEIIKEHPGKNFE